MGCRLLGFASIVILCSAVLAPAWAAHTREDAVALVRRAAEFLQNHDRATAFAAFSDQHGAFRDGNLYLFVMDTDQPGIRVVAHGGNAGMIGVAEGHFFDADGNDFNSQAVALAESQGEGWVDYKWVNPDTKKIAPKTPMFSK